VRARVQSEFREGIQLVNQENTSVYKIDFSGGAVKPEIAFKLLKRLVEERGLNLRPLVPNELLEQVCARNRYSFKGAKPSIFCKRSANDAVRSGDECGR
jgi:hypothetical protein